MWGETAVFLQIWCVSLLCTMGGNVDEVVEIIKLLAGAGVTTTTRCELRLLQHDLESVHSGGEDRAATSGKTRSFRRIELVTVFLKRTLPFQASQLSQMQ